MSYPLVDFHNHYVPARFSQAVVDAAPASQRARWEVLARKLADEDLLLQRIREGELSARVVNTSPALIADAEGRVPHETIKAMNDELAERAIRELGLRGLFVDCARGSAMVDAPQARAMLEVAAQHGVPVFVHPVAPQPLTGQMLSYGLIGSLFARGTANSAALIALVEGGVFSQLPGLRVVVTAMALGGLAMAAGLSGKSLLPAGAIEVLRKHVYIDTNIPHAALIRASVELLGAARVVAGSDWPINDWPLRKRLGAAMQEAGLSSDEQQAIAAGNALELLGEKGLVLA